MHQILIIGGGTGTSTLLQGLKKYPVGLSVIVSTADDGGSSGVLRRELGVLPPGDMRQCLVALAENTKLADEFNKRFITGKSKGHALGNLILATLEKRYGINKALELLTETLKVKGQVIPVTLKPTELSAVLANGKIIQGEHNIDEQGMEHKSWSIKQLFLKPSKSANPKAIAAIKAANVIIFGPGDLFTSTLPNLLVKGISEAVKKSKAKKIFITNIMTKYGQTDGYKASDFVKVLEKYLGGKINIVLTNNKKPDAAILSKYLKEKAEFVIPDLKTTEDLSVISQDLTSKNIIQRNANDQLKRSMLRHSSEKTAKLIWGLI